MYDIITPLTLMFSLVYSFTGSITFAPITNSYTPNANDIGLQIFAILLFILSPLLVLGFWLKKKAILWQ